MTAIAVAAAPLAELPAAPLRIAAAFACNVAGLDHVSVRPADDEGQVIVTGCSGTQCAEIACEGMATAELLLPVGALLVALRRLPAEHCSVVAGDDGLATLRLYCSDSTLAVSMPMCRDRGVRMPAVEPGEQIGKLAVDARVLAQASAKLREFGVLRVETIAQGWQFSGEASGMTMRCLIAGVASKAAADE